MEPAPGVAPRRNLHRRLGWAAFGVALAMSGALLAVNAIAKPKALEPGLHPISVEASPITDFCGKAGAGTRLTFLGGLVLSSEEETFGGISGLSITADGTTILGVTDAGSWVSAKLITEEERPVGITDVTMAPVLRSDGRPLRPSQRDTEAIAIDKGNAYVPTEGANVILRLPIGKDGLMARAGAIPSPPAMKTLPKSKGIEAAGFAPPVSPVAGALLLVAERYGEKDDTTVGFLVGGPDPGILRIRRHDGFEATDLRFLPNGDLLLLERYYSGLLDLKMRLRLIPGASVRAGAVLDGEILLTAGLECPIDNMEGLAVHEGKDGRLILTLVSDDNFSSLQRTILLRFELNPAG
ncbi:MAG: esterase-like activity of phytase family protein [Labrys sp. (in: a-proteobacteria)]